MWEPKASVHEARATALIRDKLSGLGIKEIMRNGPLLEIPLDVLNTERIRKTIREAGLEERHKQAHGKVTDLELILRSDRGVKLPPHLTFTVNTINSGLIQIDVYEVPQIRLNDSAAHIPPAIQPHGDAK